MAQGLEVLQSALAGKRVRYSGDEAWYAWDAAGHWLRSTDGGSRIMSAFGALWGREWQIEEPPMTFMEVQQLVKQGRTLEMLRYDAFIRDNTYYKYQIRWGTDCYLHRWQYVTGAWSEWSPAMFATDVVDATDWRIVQEPSKPTNDTRMTVSELQAWIPKYLHANNWLVRNMVEALYEECPAMFREAGQ